MIMYICSYVVRFIICGLSYERKKMLYFRVMKGRLIKLNS